MKLELRIQCEYTMRVTYARVLLERFVVMEEKGGVLDCKCQSRCVVVELQDCDGWGSVVQKGRRDFLMCEDKCRAVWQRVGPAWVG